MSATILVLEDDAVLQGLLCEVLQDEGFTVIAADTPDQLLHVAPHHADLLITDLMIHFQPVGLRTIERVRKTVRFDLPVILCTAAGAQLEQLSDQIQALDAAVLAKPFTIDELIGKVEQALRRGHARTFTAVSSLTALGI